MDIKKIVQVAQEAGKIILENGGEVYRVEETITRICNAYGLKIVESFATPSVIMISVTDDHGESFTLIKRIKVRNVNLEKVNKVNELSRNIKTKSLSLDYVKKQLKNINLVARYKTKTTILSSGLISGCFTVIFGGDGNDFIVSFLIGALVRLLSLILGNIKLNDFFINIMGGGLASILALSALKIGLAKNLDEVIIGSIMLLVPGLTITNALRDTIAGDLVSGISRTIEAFFAAIAIATGSAIIFKLWIITFGGI